MRASSFLALAEPGSLWWPRVLAAAALACSLWLLVRIALLLIGGPVLPEPRLDPAELPAPVASSAPGVRLSQWHLFGDGGSAPDLSQLAAQAPETALQLTLRGTLNVDAPEGGIAIIADAQGVDQAYRVGDMLPGEARLTAIYAGRVLLSRGGVDEGLSLATPGSPAPAPGSRPQTAPTAGARPGGVPRPGNLGGAQLPGNTPVPAFVNPQMNFGAPSLDSLRAATGTDVAELAKQVNVLPVMENGRFAGVRLSVGRDSDLLDRSGLRSTDIITAVNGIPLDGPQRQVELMNALRDARQLNITIRRDGQTQNLTVGL